MRGLAWRLHFGMMSRRAGRDGRHTRSGGAVQVFPLSDVKAYMGHADIATTMIEVDHVPPNPTPPPSSPPP